MKLLAIAVAVLLAATGSPVSANEAALSRVHIRIDSGRDGHGFTVEFIAQVAAPAESVVRALSDVAALPAWLPRMKAVGHVYQASGEAVFFDTTMGLPWPVGDVHETVLASRRHDGDADRVIWQHVRGDMRRNDVLWTVTAVDAEHTEVRYQANLWFKSWLPVFLLRIAERDYAPWFVDCLERRAAALATAASPPQNAASNVVAPRSSL